MNKLSFKGFDIPLSKEHGMGFYLNDEFFDGEKDGIKASFEISEITDGIKLTAGIKNLTKSSISVSNLGFRLGIDTYMESWPEWNDKFFPTMLRCEKTHLWGYFESPLNKSFAIAVTEPVPSYHLEYNKCYEEDFGHRIYSVCLDFFKAGKLPERNPKRNMLEAEAEYEFNIYLIPLEKTEDIYGSLQEVLHIPMVSASKYTLELGEKISFNVHDSGNYTVKLISPSGKVQNDECTAEEYGEYTVIVKNEYDMEARAAFFVRKPWDFYLKAARSEAIKKQQKASTHCESWYGFFSGFLAGMHYPNAEEDKLIDDSFDELFPLMFDGENGLPLTAPTRIQNTAAMISVLTDRFEKDGNKEHLRTAARLADFIIKTQTEDGAYRNHGVHYTCVIYIAKSILELVLAERKCAGFEKMAEEHYNSARKAIDELALNLERIGTEGEHTLEDGMISCSALQLGMLALMLPENEREQYIKAAEHMLKIHHCLEQNIIPDAKMNGCSLRFWEAQYDVLFKANFMNSPHGWTAWTIYAKYYLFMLTGKVKYLKEAANAMGACIQLMDLNGNLRWAFCAEPYIEGKAFVKTDTKSADGYTATVYAEPSYRGEFQDEVIIGEEYIDMISDWFRAGEQKVMGGYNHCPLIDRNGECLKVDNQGGCCDNDVHEIFKCLEETFLNKAFCVKDENGELYTIGCRADDEKNLHVLKDAKLYKGFDMDDWNILYDI